MPPTTFGTFQVSMRSRVRTARSAGDLAAVRARSASRSKTPVAARTETWTPVPSGLAGDANSCRPLQQCARAGPDNGSSAVSLEAEKRLVMICESPLLSNCGFTTDHIREDWGTWLSTAEQITQQLGLSGDPSTWPEQARSRVFQYYLPVYMWCVGQISRHRSTGARRPLVIGISAPQGCGKSTLVEQLELLLASAGVKAASVSVDDFYLTRAEQVAVSEADPSNPLLQVRGNAGTHDLDLGRRTLEALRTCTSPDKSVKIPRYDKSAHGGKGDRFPEDAWPTIAGPVDVVLFEGWMAGFAPVGDEAAAAVHPGLVAIDRQLRKYGSNWDALVDAWIVVQVDDPEWVFKWRLEAEQRMVAAGRPGMDEAGVRDFVAKYMPAYRAYLPGLYRDGPVGAQPGRVLMVALDSERGPVASQPAGPVLKTGA
ncbi:unnamed protein product [Pedinophyceae sp. YPF-701]|nr:unnamed protein product [Pedinophyceae sp. YPF-701]